MLGPTKKLLSPGSGSQFPCQAGISFHRFPTAGHGDATPPEPGLPPLSYSARIRTQVTGHLNTIIAVIYHKIMRSQQVQLWENQHQGPL